MENYLMIDEALKPEFDMKELANVTTNTVLTFTATARQVLPCVRYSHVLFMCLLSEFFLLNIFAGIAKEQA
jgi:hypothetical protein